MGKMIIDAHSHLNLMEENPCCDYFRSQKEGGIDKSVLILNTPKEANLVLENLWKFREQGSIQLAIGMDIHAQDPLFFIGKLRKEGMRIHIGKLHPRKTDIRLSDFERVSKILANSKLDTLIIDCFVYGHQLENHIGVELGIRLAQQFPWMNFVLAHAGGCRLLESMLCTRTLKNIYYDYSLSCCYLYDTSVRIDMVHMMRFNTSRIMFGSDVPDFSPTQAKEKMLCLVREAGLTQEQADMVLGMNAQRLYWGDME